MCCIGSKNASKSLGLSHATERRQCNEPTTKNGLKLQLLLVDGTSSRLATRRLLEQRLGHTVVEASDGATALILAQKAIDNQEPFDAIFIDSAIAMRRQAFKLKLMHMWSSESNVEADPTGQTILQQLKTMGIISGRIIVLQNSSKCGRNAQSPENRPSLVLTKPIEENALTTILAGSRRIVGAMFHSCLCFLFSFILEIILSCHTNATFHS